MSRSPKMTRGITLEEFLRLPDIDAEPPYWQYIHGRIAKKPFPKNYYGLLAMRLTERIDRFAEPRCLGMAFPGLRCTFAGWSIVSDVVFLLDDHILYDDRGILVDDTLRPPDIQFEFFSPEQSLTKLRKKLLYSTSNGCPLGVLIEPESEIIDIYRPDRPPERLPDDDVLDLTPVLPGLRIPLPEIFDWLVYRRPNPPDLGAAR